MPKRKCPSLLFYPQRVRLFMLCILLFLASSGCEKRLGVYSLSHYENSWKSTVTLPTAYDPYHDFYDAMLTSPSPDHADPDESERFMDSEVTIRSVLPIPDDSIKSWNDFHLVFFWGHNNTIVPPHPSHSAHYSTYNSSTNTWTSTRKAY